MHDSWDERTVESVSVSHHHPTSPDHDHDHDHDHDEADDTGYVGVDGIRRDGLWYSDTVQLLSVGIDIGSSGSQVLFSRLVLRRMGRELSSRYAVVSRQSLYRSPVSLTPYLDEHHIDATGVAEIVEQAYEQAHVDPKVVDTGVVILTGEAIRRENSRALADSLAIWSGQFVTVTAGHHMESMLAAYGSGTVARSYEYGMNILNVDIGGGTTKIAVADHGRVSVTGAIHIGGRLLAYDQDWRISRLEPAGLAVARAVGLDVAVGKVISTQDCQRMGEWMAEVLMGAISEPMAPTAGSWWLTDPVHATLPIEGIIISGGVGEYVYGKESRHFGDLGPYLGHALRQRLEQSPVPLLPAAECIRATAIGASEYTVQVSGNTLGIAAPELLPLRNLTVFSPRYPFADPLDTEEVARHLVDVLSRLPQVSGQEPVALALHFEGDPTYQQLRRLAEAIGIAYRPYRRPLVLVFDTDVAHNIWAILTEELGFSQPLIVIDAVELKEFDFIDLGRLIWPQGVIPVTIKSLVF